LNTKIAQWEIFVKKNIFQPETPPSRVWSDRCRLPSATLKFGWQGNREMLLKGRFKSIYPIAQRPKVPVQVSSGAVGEIKAAALSSPVEPGGGSL
jgi:hypothetical protein